MTDIMEQLGGATTIMLGASSMNNEADDACVDLLSQGDPETTSVLWVTFTRQAAQCLESWRDNHESDPGEFGVVVVGETPAIGAGEEIDSAVVETISTPSDLTGIGITITEFVSGRSGEILVCFDSLTALLQYVDLETAYEFLHALTGQLYSAGAVSHFHVDPSAHDEQTLDTLRSLFDAEVNLSESDISIRTRYPLDDH